MSPEKSLSQDERRAAWRKYGRWLLALRESLGLDQAQMATKVGVSAKTIKQVEYGLQGLGRAAQQQAAEIARAENHPVPEVCERVHYVASGVPDPVLECVVDQMLSPVTQAAVRALCTAMQLDERRAWLMVLREKVKSAGY